MASSFNLTAQINLRGPTNLKPIVSQIRKQLGSIDGNINLKIDNKAAKSVDAVTNRLSSMNKVLIDARNNTLSLNQSLRELSGSLGSIQTSSNAAASGVNRTSQSVGKVSKDIKIARTEMEEFGRQSSLAVRRFAAFSGPTILIFSLTSAITSAFRAFIDFDKQLVKLQQVTGRGAIGVKILQDEITNLATSLGVGSASLIEVASTLAQAGLNIEETRIALRALAKTELAPSFENLTKTTEGAIAVLRQFGLEASELEGALGSINAVAAAFAVESGDIIAAIQRTGGVFASASKGVSQGTDALNEFVAIFTSVRQTTRESAETIATGLRTIFTRIQRVGTIKQLREFGVELQDLEGKFVGPFEAVKRLSEALNQLDPRDVKFSTIVEELGGFRQIGKVIPLIQQFAVAQQALGVAQRGQSSLSDAQVKAQESLANQISKVREQFLALIRDIGQSTVFQGFFKIVLGLTSGLISLAGAFKPILPILAIFGAIKGVSAIGQFATGFFGGIKKGGGAGGAGQNIGETLSGAKEKQRAEATSKAADATKLNTDALKGLTTTVQNLDNTIKNISLTTLASGGRVLGFNKGGVVPGSGRGDKVPAMLEPGEVVMNNSAVNKYGRGNLVRMNKYALGGSVEATGETLSGTYRSLSNLVNPKEKYKATIVPQPIQGNEILPDMEERKKKNPSIPNWKNFEYAVAKKYGLSVAGGNKFLDYPSVPGEAKFLKPDEGYGRDEETGFIKGNNNETMLAKLIGAGLYPAKNKVQTYYPANINEFRKLAIGGRIQAFASGGKTEPYYGQAEVEAAKAAQAEYQKSIQEAFSLESIYFDVLEGKSIAQGIGPEVYGTGVGKLQKGQPGVIGTKKVSFTKADTADRKKATPDTKALKSAALVARQAQLQAYIDAEDAVGVFKQSGVLTNVSPDILSYIQTTISNLNNSILDTDTTESIRKKLTNPNLAAFSGLMQEKQQRVEVQGQRTKLAEVFNSILETYGSDVSVKEIDAITGALGKKLSRGGIASKFAIGGEVESIDSTAIIRSVEELGGPQQIRGLLGVDKINAAIKQVESQGAVPTSKQLFSKIFLDSQRSGPYLSTVSDLLGEARLAVKQPRIFSEEEKVNSTKLAVVGMTPFDLNEIKFEELAGRIVSLNLATLKSDKAPAVEQMRSEIDKVLGNFATNLGGQNLTNLDDQTKETIGLGNLEGYMIEAVLARLGANPGKLDDRSVDYANGLGSAASLFGVDPNIPTEVKRDAKGGLSKARENFANYFKKFAFGGRADGPSGVSDKSKFTTKEQWIEEFKRNDRVNNTSSFDANNNPLPHIDDFIKESLTKKSEKIFGQIALRDSGSRIQATYIKEGEAGEARSGQVIADRVNSSIYAVQSSAATKGYGPKLYDVVMEAATASGGMLTSDRKSVSAQAKKVWDFYFNNRGDVKKTPLDPENWVSNSRLLDEKLYGPPDTWPVATDPAWILQSGYSKSPSDINNPNLVRRLAIGGSANTVPAMVSNGEAFVPPNIAKKIGYSKLDKMNQADRNGMKGFAAGGISTFKGAGNGTSDSIGPIGLPTGSYVIREKATKALGLNKGGSVGIQHFETGGRLSKEERKRIKEQYLAEQRGGINRQEAYDAGALRPDYQSSGPGKGGTSTQVKVDLAAEALLAPVREEILKRYAKIYDEEKKGIADFYQQKVNKALAAGEEITPIVNEAKAVLAETKAKLTQGAQLEVGRATSSATQNATILSSERMEGLKASKDPFYAAGKAAESYASGGSSNSEGLPKVNPKIAEERQQYLQFKAEQSGMNVGGYKYSMAQKIGQSKFNVERETVLGRTETRASATGRRRELEGINVKESLKADTQEGRRVQSIVDEFAANLQKADPSLGAGKARDAAIALAEGLSDGTKSVEEIISANETLKTTLDGNIDSTKIMEEAFRRTALEMGESVENLKANVSNKQIEQQSFIKGTEGQRFGALAEFAPGLTEKISKTRGGKALASGADFISGKGGRTSKAFARAGGFTGIGAGLAVGAEGLKQLLPKSVTSDPNTAGALGALSGAGTGAAMGAQIGSLAGPIGTLIGGVGGAIIGGIQGFFNAKNQAILTNAIENVAKTTGQLDIAFKKLEADANAVNLGNAQKAFGEVLGAQQDIRDMAFKPTGFTTDDALGTAGYGVAGAAGGAAIGAIAGKWIGGLLGATAGTAVAPGAGTAVGGVGGALAGAGVGAAVGAGIGGLAGTAYGYFNRPSQAQREEALGATIQQSGADQEAATRLAEGQLKMTSTEDIDKILKGMGDGISGLNPIVEQYAKGMAKATGQSVEQVKGQAEEQAALDAFMKLRKEAGATDEAIGKELEKNSKGAISIGKEALEANAKVLLKQQLLARATKEVAIATESLLDVYRRINAEAERYSGELEQFGADIDAMVGGLGGDTSMRAVNRQNEQVLGNVSAYSTDEVRSAANASAGLLGGTPEAQNLANQAVAQKVIQDQIPALLRNAKNPGEEEQAIGQIRALLESQGLGGAAIDTVLTDLENTMAEGTKSGTGTSEQDLQDQIDRSFSTVGKGLEALQNVTKKYNDTLQQARKFQADYNKAVLEAGSYLRKATQVRLNAELDLAKALGRSPTLEELNKPFDVEVGNLTGKLVESGDLAAGAASDPMAIAAAISSAERRKQNIEQNAPGLIGAAANIPGGEAGDPLRQELNQAQIDNISAIGDLTIASAEGRQALEKLATDGTKAANALAKIQEEQQALEGFAAFAQNVFTAEPQELAKMELQATALNAAQASGPEFMKSRNNRQQAFAGLEQEKQFLTPQEYRDAQGDLLRKSFESQGKKGDDVVRKIGGKEFTLDQFIERVKGGVDQTDPNVVAFREASEVQAKANEALGKLNMEQAFIIQDAMLRLEFFLSDKFPDILKNAQTNAETDSQTKPEVKPEVKPRGPSTAESNVAKGEALVKSGKERVAAAEKEFEELPFYARGSENVGRINQTINRAQEDIRTGNELVSTNKPIAEKDKAARTMEASLEASQRSLDEILNKAAETEKNKVKAEEAINKAKETRDGGRPQMVGTGGQTASGYTPRNEAERQAQAAQVTESRFAGTRAPIQAPPAPGTQQQATQAIVSTVDPIAEAIRQAQVTEASGSLERLEGSKKSKEKDMAKLQNRARAERMAAKAAGTYTEPTKSEAALATDEQTLASINEQITEQKQKLAALAKQAKLEEQGQTTTPDIGPGLVDANGNRAYAAKPTGGLDQNGTFTAPTIALTPPSPVPVTMPQQASYTNQQAVSTTGEKSEDKKMAREAQAITIDSASIESLNAFNTTFGSYVDKLVTFEFPTIPDVIEMKGSHVVDVRISGAAAFEGLKKDFETMMQKEIKKAMGRIWGQSSGQMGERPAGTESPPK